MKTIRLFQILLLTVLFSHYSIVRADNFPDVQQASQSVYRIWVGIPLPAGFVRQIDGAHIQALQTQHIAEQVPLKGMSLKNKSSGKIKALSGEGILFNHGDQNFLLVASGSAYAVSNKGHLVTNATLADNSASHEAMFIDASGLREMGNNGGKAQVFVLAKQTAGQTPIALQATKQIARDVQHNLAVLQADNLPMIGLKLADSQFAKSSDRVFAVGAEGAFNQLTGKQSAIDRVDYFSAIANEGTLDKRVKQKQTNMWLHNATLSGSMSGGALINQCGQVLGTTALVGDKGGESLAIDAGELLPLLRKHSIPFQVYQGRCGGVVAKAENIADGAERVVQAAQHNPRGWITVLVLGILTLVATVVAWRLLLWVWGKRRKTAQRAVAATPVAPVPSTSSIAERLKVHNNPPPVSASEPRMQYDAAPRTQYDAPIPRTQYDHYEPRTQYDRDIQLIAISGNWGSIPISSRLTVIGRRHDCTVMLNNPKISGQHAKIWVENGQVWVQDLNSTNGTFLNGQRIHKVSVMNINDVVQFTSDETIARFRLSENTHTVAAVGTMGTYTHVTRNQITWRLQPLYSQHPRITLTQGQSMMIGRSSDNDVVINMAVVSGKHCRIWVDNQGNLQIQDTNSTNGTFINDLGNRISQATLQSGQILYLADKQTAYRVETAA